ncbi:MAG: helix-turn-helix domain-containing protein [Pseudomonadota bacterium]
MENGERKKNLTTSQAAKLLSVSSDTMLKWVRAGKIKATRTLGGHFRIHIDDLGVGPADESGIGPSRDRKESAFQYCWEYLPGDGEPAPECKECIAFRSRARRCYELKDLPGGIGCLQLYCKDSCDDCDYYKVVMGREPHVLVFGKRDKLLRGDEGQDDADGIEIRFVDTEYNFALAVQDYRPDYIVMDCSFGRKRIDSLCASLESDDRIPVARIILASRTRKQRDYCAKPIFGWIKKPFTIVQVTEFIETASQ